MLHSVNCVRLWNLLEEGIRKLLSEQSLSAQNIIKLLQRFGPRGPLQAYSTRHLVQNRQMQVLTVVLKYKTGRLKLEKSIVTGVRRSGVHCDGVRHGGVCHDIIHPD